MSFALHAPRHHSGILLRSPGKMPLDAHKLVGGLIKNTLAMSHHRAGVQNPLKAVQCRLDGWAMQENPDQKLVPNDEFNQIYYHLPPRAYPRRISPDERFAHITGLEKAREILCEHYPPGEALKIVLTKIDHAIRSLESWIRSPSRANLSTG